MVALLLMPARRFPPPWSVDEQSACFVVRDQNGQQLAYVYFEDEPGRRSPAKPLTKDKHGGSRRISRSCRNFLPRNDSVRNRMLRILHSNVVKKRLWTTRLARSDRASVEQLPPRSVRWPKRAGGHVWGTKAKPLASCRRRLCCFSKTAPPQSK